MLMLSLLLLLLFGGIRNTHRVGPIESQPRNDKTLATGCNPPCRQSPAVKDLAKKNMQIQ